MKNFSVLIPDLNEKVTLKIPGLFYNICILIALEYNFKPIL